MTEQLALDLPIEVDFSPESYIASPANQDARAALNRWRDWPDRRMALIGPAGAGKSHLSHIWAWQMDAQICTGETLEATLDTLPDRELGAGLAEIIKAGAIADAGSRRRQGAVLAPEKASSPRAAGMGRGFRPCSTLAVAVRT